jgi:hypothetical protein
VKRVLIFFRSERWQARRRHKVRYTPRQQIDHAAAGVKHQDFVGLQNQNFHQQLKLPHSPLDRYPDTYDVLSSNVPFFSKSIMTERDM